jgi:splicing factor 3B subunit 3
MHETVLEDMVYSVASWKGKLICSVGHNLRVYELGQKKLLKKAELKEINSPAINI